MASQVPLPVIANRLLCNCTDLSARSVLFIRRCQRSAAAQSVSITAALRYVTRCCATCVGSLSATLLRGYCTRSHRSDGNSYIHRSTFCNATLVLHGSGNGVSHRTSVDQWTSRPVTSDQWPVDQWPVIGQLPSSLFSFDCMRKVCLKLSWQQ